MQNSCNTVYCRNMVCFRYMVVNTMRKGDIKDNTYLLTYLLTYFVEKLGMGSSGVSVTQQGSFKLE